MEKGRSLRVGSVGELVGGREGLFVKQIKEWTEIVINVETKNKYEILGLGGELIGAIVERSGGVGDFLRRIVFRSHRGLAIDVLNVAAEQLLHLSRGFFFFFSDLYVEEKGVRIGSVHRRFGLLHKKYDLKDGRGACFATIKAPIWRLWTFPIFDGRGKKVGVITKKWQGLIKEAFTDADQFLVDFGQGHWDEPQKVILLAAAISIDFDFFENNQGSGGLLSLGD